MVQSNVIPTRLRSRKLWPIWPAVEPHTRHIGLDRVGFGSQCMYMRICKVLFAHVYTCIYILTCVYMCMHVSICTHVYIHTYAHVCTCIYMMNMHAACTYMYTQVYACIYICMYVYMYINIYIYILIKCISHPLPFWLKAKAALFCGNGQPL